MTTSMPRKAVLYNELKLAKEGGAQFEFPSSYVSMTEATLEALHEQVFGTSEAAGETTGATTETAQAWLQATAKAESGPIESVRPVRPGLLRQGEQVLPEGVPPVREWGNYVPETLARLLGVPFTDNGDKRAGLRINTHGPDDVLRVSSDGKIWYQDEVAKPAIPQPRMRRKVRYIDPGVKTVEIRRPDGHLDESFEVAGDQATQAEYKVTLPSWQVGIYYDPRLPFRVHVYNGRRGFDRMDVMRYYGGLDLVPSSIQNSAIYDGDLCYDIMKVRDAMERELRELTGVRQAQPTF
jgi:hypothetical protein